MAIILVFCVFSCPIFGQEVPKKKRARISLDYLNKNKVRQLRATVKTKVNRSYQKVGNVSVKFYFDEKGDKNLLGSATSDVYGEAIFNLPESIGETFDSTLEYTFISSIENDPVFSDKEKEIVVKESIFELSLEEEDSVKIINVFVGTPIEKGKFVPVEDVNVKIYVQRLFGRLLIGEDFEVTDDEGRMSFDFPSDIPGDKDGNLEIIASVEDDDNFGNLESSRTISWGVPVIVDNKIHERELWSAGANAPTSLVLIVSSMVLGIWGVIIYTILQTFTIWKLGKQPT